MQKKNSFILYTDNKVQINMLTDQQAGQLFKALVDFADSGDIPPFEDSMTALAFSFISAQISRDSAKFEETCKRRAEYGKKGGIASQKAKKAKTTSSDKQNQANQADTVTVTETVTETVSETVTDTVSDTVTDAADKLLSDTFAEAAPSGKRTAKQQHKDGFLTFGTYRNVRLSQAQYDKLCTDFGAKTVSDYIRRIDEWVQLKGKTYKDYDLAIRQWLSRDEKSPPAKKSSLDGFDFSKFVNNF